MSPPWGPAAAGVSAYGRVLDGIGVGVVDQAPDGRVEYANPTAQRLLARGPLVGQDLSPAAWELLDPEGQVLPDDERPDVLALRDGQEVTGQVVGHRVGDELVWLRVGVLPVHDDDGGVVRLVTSFVDVSSSHTPGGLSLSSVGQAQAIVDATPVGICMTTQDGIVELVNPAYERLYGFPAEELLGRSFTLVVPPEGREQPAALHDQFTGRGSEIRGEWTVVGKDGVARTILADACRVLGSDGRIRNVTFAVDITDRKTLESDLARANEALAEMAFHDSLTGVLNHRGIMEAMDRATRTAARYGRPLSVAVIDLDHFKAVNDAHGHPVGDATLAGFAQLLARFVRAPDQVGRSGGEEFVVLMPETTATEAAAALDRLHVVCRETQFAEPAVSLTFSAGVTEHHDGDRPGTILARADEAMYRAKGSGRARTVTA
ncbi:diguanylate cyclase [Cellulomonas sp. KRMCY2]|uniref:sensor domain-containing diguanylate cyclase n=1 Tax=Cellulomonas sp. KRMCY2 TaxID=1304865 RepID=UPI00045EC24C|nr:diguanylate cyclase [Cellulomonas sp. KRMCY2]